MRGYEVKYRGWTEVKGKGKMETYFVLGKQNTRPPGFQRQPSQYSSLAAVVYAMAQARRKHTGHTRKVWLKREQRLTSSVSAGGSVMGRGKSHQRSDSSRKLFNYSSVRLNHRTGNPPLRRNTTKAPRNLHAR